MSALLPCPFCGGNAEYVEGMDEDGRFFAVQCSGCGCGSGKHYPLMDDARPNAASEWNRRTPPPLPTREEVEATMRRHMRLKWTGHDHADFDARSITKAADAVLRLLGGEKG